MFLHDYTYALHCPPWFRHQALHPPRASRGCEHWKRCAKPKWHQRSVCARSLGVGGTKICVRLTVTSICANFLCQFLYLYDFVCTNMPILCICRSTCRHTYVYIHMWVYKQQIQPVEFAGCIIFRGSSAANWSSRSNLIKLLWKRQELQYISAVNVNVFFALESAAVFPQMVSLDRNGGCFHSLRLVISQEWATPC